MAGGVVSCRIKGLGWDTPTLLRDHMGATPQRACPQGKLLSAAEAQPRRDGSLMLSADGTSAAGQKPFLEWG